MRKDVQLPNCLRADGEAEGSSTAPVKTDLPGEGFVQTGVDWGWCGRPLSKPLLKEFLEASRKYSSTQRGGNGFTTQ